MFEELVFHFFLTVGVKICRGEEGMTYIRSTGESLGQQEHTLQQHQLIVEGSLLERVEDGLAWPGQLIPIGTKYSDNK